MVLNCFVRFLLLALLMQPFSVLALPKRVLSLNLCTDQMLLALASHGQIHALSPFSRDKQRSFAHIKALAYPQISGRIEEILREKPDLVLLGAFDKQGSEAIFARHAIKTHRVDEITSLVAAFKELSRLGEVLGTARQSNALIEAIKAEIKPQKSPITAIAFERRGYVSGKMSLLGDILAKSGYILPVTTSGFISLEKLIRTNPQRLVLFAHESEDQGAALLQHEAVLKHFPPKNRIILSEASVLCAGGGLIEAMKILSRQ
jgi:iron complex transport system substrate-binding protein